LAKDRPADQEPARDDSRVAGVPGHLQANAGGRLKILTWPEVLGNVTREAKTVKRQSHLTIFVFAEVIRNNEREVNIVKCPFHLTIFVCAKAIGTSEREVKIVKWDSFL